MAEALTGWVHGTIISLDSGTARFDGQRVRVILEPIDEATEPGGSPSEPASGQWTGELELEWLRENGRAYAGQWVALAGNRLIASGPHASDVYREARARGVRTPFVTLVEPDVPYLAGW